MKRSILLSAIFFICHFAESQTLQTVTTSGNTSTNAIRVTGETNIGTSGGGEIVLGVLTTPKINDTRNFIGWKNSGNTITNGLAGTLLLQGRSDFSDVPIDFATGLGTPALRMRIAGNGNVAIGNNTLTPSSRLFISGSGNTTSTTSLLVQSNSGYPSLKVVDNGYVGIGTTQTGTPRERLEIQDGNILVSSGVYALNTIMGAVKISHAGWPASYAGMAGMTNSGGLDQLDLLFYTCSGGATEKMRIMSNSGNVLIGKISQTNSSYKLDVNGNARMNKVVVNTTGADFVFDSAYHLLSLDSLNTFIQKNHHLPDIPPADEMQREGLDLGDNQIKLLQKIEELTLIVIEQNKRIEQLEKSTR